MSKLEHVDPEALRRALADATSAKAVKRLMIALAYRDGVPVTTLTDRYGIARSTLYYWLDRFEDEPIEAAIEDEPRPGRPAELTADERTELARHLADTPGEYGYDPAEWTPRLVRDHIEREFGVSYSLGHVRRLLREAGGEFP